MAATTRLASWAVPLATFASTKPSYRSRVSNRMRSSHGSTSSTAGRTPDYKAAFLRTLNANRDYYGDYADNPVTYYKSTQERVT